jgi:predicted protein tyrosine phosphatase
VLSSSDLEEWRTEVTSTLKAAEHYAEKAMDAKEWDNVVFMLRRAHEKALRIQDRLEVSAKNADIDTK